VRSKKELARQALKDPEALGLTLSAAADVLSDGAHHAWEYESTWDFLEDHGCLPSPEGRERLMAVTAVRLNPAHQWDGGVFQNLVEALNGRVATADMLSECSVGELLWTVVEAGMIADHYELPEPFYGTETQQFTAAVCAYNGLAVIPSELEFCTEALKAMPASGREDDIKKKTLALLKEGGEENEGQIDPDTPEEVQARILKEVGAYVFARKARLERDLASLS